MFGWFKKDKEPDPGLPAIAHLTIGRSASIDEMVLKFWPQDSLAQPASPSLNIVAQGHVDLGEGAHLHRFYPDDDSALIQIQGGDGLADTAIGEVMLWTYHDVQYPSTDAEWNGVKARIRDPLFELMTEHGSLRYERAWFDTTPGPQDPMTYWESVHTDLDGHPDRRIFQTAMLFARRLSNGEDDMLLVNMEEPEDAERAISYMVGRPLAPHHLIV